MRHCSTLAERLEQNSRVDPLTGCRLWMGCVNRSGYAYLKKPSERKNVLAHRVAWELVHGEITDGLHVCHHCDTPRCINVEHLFLGTNADNRADSVAKGRQASGTRCGDRRGEKNANARLTDEIVSVLRARKAGGERTAALAAEVGVRREHLWRVLTGRNWS